MTILTIITSICCVMLMLLVAWMAYSFRKVKSSIENLPDNMQKYHTDVNNNSEQLKKYLKRELDFLHGGLLTGMKSLIDSEEFMMETIDISDIQVGDTATFNIQLILDDDRVINMPLPVQLKKITPKGGIFRIDSDINEYPLNIKNIKSAILSSVEKPIPLDSAALIWNLEPTNSKTYKSKDNANEELNINTDDLNISNEAKKELRYLIKFSNTIDDPTKEYIYKTLGL